MLLLGGEPFPEPVLMWWNFVARSREELEAAYRQWESGDPRFGRLRSPLARIPAPAAVLDPADIAGGALVTPSDDRS